ncbi:MAG: hypothetical protein AAF481_00875 [Acidobacteriota bacterium]
MSNRREPSTTPRRAEASALADWLEAEGTERPEAADAAFFRLFAALPMLSPPAEFAERVLAALPSPVPRPLRGRSLLAACFLLLGLGAGFLPAVLRVVGSVTSLSGLVEGFSGAVVSLARWSAEAVDLWQIASGVGAGGAALLETPPIAIALMLSMLISAVALRKLAVLIANERSWSHVASTL